ncbi:MAG TPA: thiamine-phosphate kinase [Rhizomicrobium sp.]|nr:thiamine-phosphate kinase [Rhizomicrobium sp.]
MTSGKTDRRLGEFELIAALFAPLSRNAPGAFGLTDDAAVLVPPLGHELVLKTDAIVEGVHFLHDDPAESVARKALRVNLSDLAAKGAEPAGYLMTLLLPAWPDMAWLEAFAGGLAADQAEFGLSLLGGDTSATPGPLAISIAAMGFVPQGQMIRRAGATSGDCIFVSGTIGDAAGGLAVLKDAKKTHTSPELVARYRVPSPRLQLGRALRGIATAALDVSDGLVADLAHMAKSSRVRMVIEAARVPLSPALQHLWGSSADAISRAVTAGDDYEIAFTAPASQRGAIIDAAARCGVSVTEIGRVEAGEGVVLRDQGGKDVPIVRGGFTHF